MNTAFQPSGTEVKHAAFTDHRRSGQLSQSRRRVINALAGGAKTRNQLAECTGLPLASICGRCRELLDLDYIDVAGMSADSPARQVLGLTEEGREAMSRAAGGGA
ncbi:MULTISPECIES: hypothetical protein [unclassified Halomonas]|uniref:hypothetical protein n=1 Tax=unclassified Halomonas TaxID=2609666 RepID=UPI00209FB089|nr:MULTISPECIES: hypothetical protein [unclassified Halomonas]MCP1312999.1 hypothetical protein [Halomonas sp. 707D7]MCP1328471.1 hypothetical protein [Halomonas sp. 707D4]